MSTVMGPRTTGILALSAVDESVGRARRWLRQMLGQVHGDGGLDSGATDDSVLVLSELVTNAIRHAGGDIVCHAAVSDTKIEIAVSDFGPQMPVLRTRDPLRVGGVGLLITADLSSQWGVSEFAGGKTVWARFTLAGAGPAESRRVS